MSDEPDTRCVHGAPTPGDITTSECSECQRVGMVLRPVSYYQDHALIRPASIRWVLPSIEWVLP